MAIPKDLILEDETPTTEITPEELASGWAYEEEIPIATPTNPYLTFGGGGEELPASFLQPEQLAAPQLAWQSAFGLPDLSKLGLSRGMVPSQGQTTYSPVANYAGAMTSQEDMGREPTNPNNPGGLGFNYGTMADTFAQKEEIPLGWNFAPNTPQGQTYGEQGKGRGLEAGALQNALGGNATSYAGLNPAQQAYADMMNAQYNQSQWWQGGLLDRNNRERIQAAMQNNLPNVRTFDPRTLGGRASGDLAKKSTGYGSAARKFNYGGGGGGRGSYSSYTSPASWFNALLSWRI